LIVVNPTSLSHLIKDAAAVCCPNGLLIRVQPTWAIAGEKRLSYTTILRLIECCREHHWNEDIATRQDGGSLDSIARNLDADFRKPVAVPSTIGICYRVSAVGRKSYTLTFEVLSTDGTVTAEASLVSVFFDSTTQSAVLPPRGVLKGLQYMKDSVSNTDRLKILLAASQ
jgi:acyl-CoA thioesterase FadM